MPGIFYPNVGALQKAAVLKAALDGGKIRLFKSDFVPLVNSPLADFVTNEADYDGYVAGGVTVAAWLNPLLDPAGGASIEMPIVQFAYVDSPPSNGNTIGGWFYTTAGGMLICGEFPQPIPMQANGQGIPLAIKLVEATGQ